MKRLLAIAAALGMIGLSLFVRGRLDDDDPGDRRSGSPSGDEVLVCEATLKPACNGLGVEVRYEDAALTAQALADGTADVSAWLAPAPWTDVAAAHGATGLGEPSPVIARSPVAFVIWNDRADAITIAACSVNIGWTCLTTLSDFASIQAPFPERIRLGIPEPDTGTGFIVLGGAGTGLFARSSYARNDFDTATAFDALLRDLASETGPGDLVEVMLQQGPGAFTAVASLEALVGPRIARSARKDDVRLTYPEPVATADLVLTTRRGDDRLADLATDERLRDALAKVGWRVPGHDLAAGLDADLELPGDDGLAPAGVLLALRDRFEENR
jgi:hypothetical protein